MKSIVKRKKIQANVNQHGSECCLLEGIRWALNYHIIQQTKVLYDLLSQIEVLHLVLFLFSILESSKLQNTGRKQSVSRSLKHLFHSSNKFVKTLKRSVIHFISQTFQVIAFI